MAISGVGQLLQVIILRLEKSLYTGRKIPNDKYVQKKTGFKYRFIVDYL